MTDTAFGVKVYTPFGLQLEDSALEIVLPSAQGEMGVLAAHVKYAGLLGTGILQFESADSKQIIRAVISGGFCSFADNTFTILADSIDLPDSVDRERYGEERSALHTLLSEGNREDPERVRAREKLERIEAIDRLIGN